MATALDAPPGKLDAGEAAFVGRIRQHGWTCTYVLEDERGPGFVYSTGFWLTYQQPEVIMFSVPSDAAQDMFWVLDRVMKSGGNLPLEAPISDVIPGHDVYLYPVLEQHSPDYLGWSRWFYGSDAFPTVQLIWPKSGGEFPWSESATAAVKRAQPSLTALNW